MICLNETEVAQIRETLVLLLIVHSRSPTEAQRAQALATLKADGVTDAEGAQMAILERVLKMSEKLL